MLVFQALRHHITTAGSGSLVTAYLCLKAGGGISNLGHFVYIALWEKPMY